MGSARSEWLWSAVRIVTFAVMAAVVFGTAMLLMLKLADLDLAVAGSPFYPSLTPWPGDVRGPWEDENLAPLGSVLLSGDGGYQMVDYIPLLGFAWWFGPLTVVPILAGGLAIVYYSRHPRVPGSYLTGRMWAAGAGLVLFGMAAYFPYACLLEWDGPCTSPEGGLLLLAIGGLWLGFALFQRRWLLGAAAGGVIGLAMGLAGYIVMARLIDTGLPWFLWLLVFTAVGAAVGVALSAASRRVLLAAIVVVAFLPVGLVLAASTGVGAMVVGALGLGPSPSPPPCDLRPNDEADSPDDTTCGEKVTVNGSAYFYGAGGWRDEDGLRLEPVGRVTYPNLVGIDPMAYRLVGVNPRRILVLKNLPASQASSAYSVLWGRGRSKNNYCSYADLWDLSRPEICRRSKFGTPSPVPSPRDEES